MTENNKRLIKGDATKIILEIAVRWMTKSEIISKCVDRTKKSKQTFYTAFDKLVEHKLLEQSPPIFDNAGNPINKYRNKSFKEGVDPEYLKLIINNYNSENIEKRKMAERQIAALVLDDSGNIKILDKDFIDFVIKNLIKSYKEKDFHPNGTFEEIFDTITIQLKRNDSERQKELLEYIQQKTADVLKNVILDSPSYKSKESMDYFKKDCALSNLISMDYPVFDIVFKFLETMIFYESQNLQPERRAMFSIDGQTIFERYGLDNYEDIKNNIEKIIKLNAEIDLVDCQKKLWAAYDKQKDKIAKLYISDLINMTSLGYLYEKHNEQVDS